MRSKHFAALLLALLALSTPLAPAQEAVKNAKYAMIGENATVDGLHTMRVEGLGFVVGLKGNGSNPPPNNYRKNLIDLMKKKGIANPTEWVESTDTSIVLLRAFLPPGIRKGDPIDVEVWVPPGDETVSLKGGRLLEVELKEILVTNKHRLDGETYVKVDGPVLVTVDPNASEEERQAALRKGRVLGRGKCLIDRDFRLVVENSKHSTRLTKHTAFRINQRFRSPQTGSKGIANALDYEKINLAVPPEYKHDVERFLHVVRRIPQSESKTFEDRLLGVLETELMNPATAIEASLRLEAIGPAAIPTLKEGLESSNELVQFCSAQSLAYLRDPSGLKILAELADRSNVYRAHALTALAAGGQVAARGHLVKLLNSQSSEARYGAFRALWMLNPNDPAVRSMTVGPDEFALHPVASSAPPMVHVARSFRPEIVLFNPQQQLLTPINIRAGGHLVVTASAGSEEVHLASFKPGPGGAREARRIASLSLGDVIAQAGELGASYPDVVDFLMQAAANNNLVGRLEINALPKALGLDTLQAIGEDEESRRWRAFQIGTPNLFDGRDGGQKSPGAGAFAKRLDPVATDLEEDANAGDPADGAPPPVRRKWWQFGPLRPAAN
jgi:flagellar basal body P-ring protein FlgI